MNSQSRKRHRSSSFRLDRQIDRLVVDLVVGKLDLWLASSTVELEIWQVDFARIASFDRSAAGGRDRLIDQQPGAGIDRIISH